VAQNTHEPAGDRSTDSGGPPGDIKAFCILQAFWGSLEILGGAVLVFAADFLRQFGTGPGLYRTRMGSVSGTRLQAGTPGPETVGLLGVAVALVGVGTILSLYGLWHLRPWGWILAVVVQFLGVSVNLSFLGGFAVPGAATGTHLTSVVVAVALIGYLWYRRSLFDIERYLPIG